MKIKSISWSIALLSCSLFLTSCEDILGHWEKPTPVSNNEPFYNYKNYMLMDFSVNPGDSFYDFALGNWLANHDNNDEGLADNLANSQNEELFNAFYSSTDGVVSHLTQYVNDSYTEAQALADVLNFLKDNDISDGSGIKDSDFGALTTNDILTVLGNLQNAGFSPLLKRNVGTNEGKFVNVLVAAEPCKDMMNKYKTSGEASAKAWIKEILQLLQPNPATEVIGDDIINAIFNIEIQLQNANSPQYSSDLRERQHAMPVAQLKVSDLRARTRNGGPSATDVYNAFGVTSASVDPKAVGIVNLILSQNAKTLAYFICYKVIAELEPIIPNPNDPKFNLKNNLYTKLSTAAPQIINRVHYDELKGKGDVEGCSYMMELMRQVMDMRIANLEWMSGATKTAARNKLAGMIFNIGVPSTRPGESLTLTGTTLMQDVLQLYKQREDVSKSLVGHENTTLGWDYFLLDSTIGVFNAYYTPNLNQLFILPAFISSTLFPTDDEYMRYATATVFGHEMSHGFDASGSQYDYQGSINNWWTPNDKSMFEALQDLMKERFNELWQYDGVHANGEQTLDENMADLGGVRIAFELYRMNMEAAGYQQDVIDYQLREFFLHYALVWQEDANVEDLKDLLLNDTHSSNRNRVDGILRMMDEWYELFNVTNGVLYLDPADRVTIW